jgi:hypothetical protein
VRFESAAHMVKGNRKDSELRLVIALRVHAVLRAGFPIRRWKQE